MMVSHPYGQLHQCAKRTLVMLCWCVATLMADQTFAGCTTPHAASRSQAYVSDIVETGTPDRLAEVFWNFRGPARVLYENGQLKYFPVLSNTIPCHGPECHGPSENELTPVVVISTQRITTAALASLPSNCAPLSPNGRYFEAASGVPHTPYFAGPLRPPQHL